MSSTSASNGLRRGLVALAIVVSMVATALALISRVAWAAASEGSPPTEASLAPWAMLAAAASAGLGALGAGYAVARVGSAAVGAIAEKPELFGRVLVLVGLAEGIAIYGLIVSILILNRIG